MAITLTGTNGLFTRWGVLGFTLNLENTNRGSALNTRIDTIVAQFNTVQRSVLDGLYAQVENFRQAFNNFMQNTLQLDFQNTLIQQANDNIPLETLTVTNGLLQLIAQMEDTSQSIYAPTLAVPVTPAAGNVGDAQLIVSTTDQVGLSLDYMFSEDITCTVTADGYPEGSATQNQEPVQCLGEPASSTPLDWNWPLGSGANQTLTTIDAETDAGSEVTNGGFESWGTSPVSADDWTISGGTWGTDVVQLGTPNQYRGTFAAQFTGTNTPFIYQTLANVQPNTVYAVCMFLKKNGAPASGTFRVRLVDGAGSPNVIADDQGVDNVIEQSAAALTTSYAAVTGFFRTPYFLPNTTPAVVLQVGMSVALNAGSVYLDDLAIAPATQLYNGGPFAAIFAGATPQATGDYYTIAASNSKGVDTFVRLCDRMLGLRDLGLRIPSAATGTIPENLIS